MEEKGSISLETVFDSLLRMGLVMQLVVLTVSIMITILLYFIYSIGFGAVLSKIGLAVGPRSMAAAFFGESALVNETRIVNETQNWIQNDVMKWKP
ncbi:hypothetical protein METP3_03645 [Methanosarcinales archaeon]|nr:hypothetical protein METP3_03645 [Methanosarcinales archaeon]